MVVSEHKKYTKKWNPFRSRGERSTACIRCHEYRRTGTEGEPLARVGLRGMCARAGGCCQEVRP